MAGMPACHSPLLQKCGANLCPDGGTIDKFDACFVLLPLSCAVNLIIPSLTASVPLPLHGFRRSIYVTHAVLGCCLDAFSDFSDSGNQRK